MILDLIGAMLLASAVILSNERVAKLHNEYRERNYQQDDSRPWINLSQNKMICDNNGSRTTHCTTDGLLDPKTASILERLLTESNIILYTGIACIVVGFLFVFLVDIVSGTMRK